VRGKCCYLSVKIGEYNIILEDQPCVYLDIEKGLCKHYEDRFKVKHCRNGKAKFECGALPAKCLYLNGRREKDDKVLYENVKNKLTTAEQQIYDNINTNPKAWDYYERYCM